MELAYRWQRCGPRGSSCVDIAGERERSRVLTAADIDARVRVVVTATNWLGQRSTASAATAAILPAAPVLVARPQIRGRPQVGRTLISDVGAWTSSRSVTYAMAWEICDDSRCRRLSASRGLALRLRGSMLERFVQVVVTATNPGGSTEAVSARTERVGLTLEGTNAADRLAGTAGSDVLLGKGGDDRLGGAAGPDVLVGGRGKDRYRAGSGDDRIRATDGKRDVIRCGGGADVVVADRKDRLGDDCEVVRRA
jgi:RTX calcium-binding nonapeptide repeat (4 copies)